MDVKVKRLAAILGLLLLAGCQPQPHYEVQKTGDTLIRTETRTGKTEILTPDGWKDAETHMRERMRKP